MNIYSKRRDLLSDRINEEGMIVLFSGKSLPNSEDENYPFNVNRNFYYLTGLDKEDMILMIYKHEGKTTERLFIPAFDELMAKWVGGRETVKNASEISGIESVLLSENFVQFFSSIYNRNIRSIKSFSLYLDLMHYHLDNIKSESIKFANNVNEKYPAIKIEDIFQDITSLRMIKDDYEINCHKEALKITNKGILAMMSYSKGNIYEAELEKVFELELAKSNCRELAFPTIAASGKNATTLHYVANNSKLGDNELFLCDLGATYNHYCADISRTFPVNGKFTSRQKEIYQIVLNAQEIVVKNAKPGITTRELNDLVVKYYEEVLPEINLDKGVFEYYFHSVSHSIGLDTHDVILEPGNTKLKPGMIISNEPGLYLSDEGIGIRIEDDLLITEFGCVNLSENIIKEVADIEAYMSK